MYIAVGQTSHEHDNIPKSQASNLKYHRFLPFAPDNKRKDKTVALSILFVLGL